MKPAKRILILFVVAAMVLPLLIVGIAGAHAEGERVNIKWFRIGNEQDPTQDRILLALQDKLNVNLEIITVPWDQGANKLNLMMTSEEQFDLGTGDHGKAFIDWAKNDLLYAYDDLCVDGKYPYVNAIVNAELYKGLKVDGKAYYKPLGLCPQQWGWIIRQDWLDNVGLTVPTTIDELYSVIKAFRENDPDKNGQNDTYGWYSRESGKFGLIEGAFRPNGGTWIIQSDGSLLHNQVDVSTLEGWKFIRKIVSEDLVNKDFVTLKNDAAQGPDSDDFAASKYGITSASIPAVFQDKLVKVTPEATLSFQPPIADGKGNGGFYGHTGGYWWGNFIPKTCGNPERVMELLDYACTMEGRELTMYGIEGVHFTKFEEKDGMRIYTVNQAECDKDWDTKKNGYMYPLTWGGLNWFEYAYIPIKENGFNYDTAFQNYQSWLPDDMAGGQFAQWQAMNTKFAQAGPLINVQDENLFENQEKLNSIFNEARVKALTAASEDDLMAIWDKMVGDWNAAGGEKVTAYANELYKTLK